MDILLKLPAIKSVANDLAFPSLAAAYMSYFPASLAQENDIALLYSLWPEAGVIANLFLALIVAILGYAALFSFANYFESYHSIPMFMITAGLMLSVVVAATFGISEFSWVNTPLSFALATVSMTFFSVIERSQKDRQ
ncbi:hypothetical protein [Vibrio parahaemolyticus]|uniref:hypothetical protein n=1 Tax=Vibrio parahaemolyticus TaxID=670 RepID=UPI0022B3383A|nr:hypothetical protein [Vibrio parahaemolyticus]ELB1989973.1 hypothetical protein [Vibrio parahaemolyticus]MCZ6311566.1 hypothetical protein [Vibrio parahaemolyticus]